MAPAVSPSRSRMSPRVEKAPAELRVQRDGAIDVGERIGILAGEIMRPGAVVIGERRVRRKRDRLRVVGDGAGKVELLALGVAAVDVGIRASADRARSPAGSRPSPARIRPWRSRALPRLL